MNTRLNKLDIFIFKLINFWLNHTAQRIGSGLGFKINAHNAGVKMSATVSDNAIAATKVMEN